MKKRRAAKKASPLLSVLIVVFFLLVFLGSRYLSSQPAPAPAESAGLSAADSSLEVHFLDIGQGDSALLFCGEKAMLIDGGKVKNNQKLISRLKELNVTHLDTVPYHKQGTLPYNTDRRRHRQRTQRNLN